MEFWLDNPRVLLSSEIYPKEGMSQIEQLNSIARFSLIYLVVIYLLNGNMTWMAFSVTLLVLTIIFRKSVEKMESILCHPKTKENPFGNFTVGDYFTDPKRPEVCDRENIKKSEELLESNIPLIKDFYNKDIALRNFYTMPVTSVVNDQTGFAKFLMGTESGECKINGNNCLKNHDTRFHRGRFFNPN